MPPISNVITFINHNYKSKLPDSAYITINISVDLILQNSYIFNFISRNLASKFNNIVKQRIQLNVLSTANGCVQTKHQRTCNRIRLEAVIDWKIEKNRILKNRKAKSIESDTGRIFLEEWSSWLGHIECRDPWHCFCRISLLSQPELGQSYPRV